MLTEEKTKSGLKELDANTVDPGMVLSENRRMREGEDEGLEKYEEHLPNQFDLKEGAERFPLMILPQVSNVCNSSCTHCWFNADQVLRSRDGTPWISEELMRKIIDEVHLHTDPKPLIRITGTGEHKKPGGFARNRRRTSCDRVP